MVRLAVAVAAAVALAGCGTGEDVAEVAPSFEPSPGPPGRVPPDEMLFGDPPATPTPEATPSQAPLPDPPEVQPVPVEDGDYDPREVFEALSRELSEAMAQGDADAVDLVVTDDCNCRRGWVEVADEMRDRGWRDINLKGLVIHTFDVIDQTPDRFAVGFEQSQAGGTTVMAETGEIVAESGPGDEIEYREVSVRQEGDVWKFERLLRFPERTRRIGEP